MLEHYEHMELLLSLAFFFRCTVSQFARRKIDEKGKKFKFSELELICICNPFELCVPISYQQKKKLRSGSTAVWRDSDWGKYAFSLRFVYLLYFAFWYMYTTTCDTLQHKYLWKKIARCKLQVLEAEWLIISSTASFMNRNLHFEFIPMEQNTSDTEKWISMDLKWPVFPNGNWIGNHK